MSVSHQYIELQDNVYKRYVKTQLGVLSGNRVNPHNVQQRLPFVLSTPDDKVVYKKIKVDNLEYDEVTGRDAAIDYDEEVLETYSETEDKIFRSINKRLFKEGLLVEYSEKNSDIDYTNALTDDEVERIAKIKNTMAFKKEIRALTKTPTLQRIMEKLLELDRPNSFIRAVQERMNELST